MTKKILLSLLIFVVFYVVFLVLWLQIKDSYGKAITTITSHMISFATDAEFKEIRGEKGNAKVFFIYKGEKWWFIGIELMDASVYTFSAPLTFAIMGCLYLFIKNRRRAYIEVIFILFFMHVLYVFITEIADLSLVLVKMEIRNTGLLNYPGFWKSLWFFVDVMVIRFAPFLVGAYLYLRFSDFENAQSNFAATKE